MSAAQPPKNEKSRDSAAADKLATAPSQVADQGVDLVSDIGEFALDNFLSEGPLKDVPILGSVVKLFRGALGVRDWIFVRKLVAFLQAAESIAPEERRKFKEQLESDPAFRERTASHLVVVLDRFDDMEKAHMLATVFAAFVGGRIGQAEMRRLSALLDRVLVTDLQALRDFIRSGLALPRASYDGLEASGLALVDHSIIRPTHPGEVRGQVEGTHFVLSPTALLLVKTVFPT